MEETPREQPRGRRILVVDDDDGIRHVLTHSLKLEGFDVAGASDGEDALQKISQERPDLVILDLMLPRYGGFELLRRLQSGNFARIPILVITGRYTDRSIEDLIRQESNVVDFMSKPLKLAALTGMLRRVLDSRTPERPGPQGG